MFDIGNFPNVPACKPERFHSGGNEWIFVVLKCAIGAKYG
jgi:hypothetical protein